MFCFGTTALMASLPVPVGTLDVQSTGSVGIFQQQGHLRRQNLANCTFRPVDPGSPEGVSLATTVGCLSIAISCAYENFAQITSVTVLLVSCNS